VRRQSRIRIGTAGWSIPRASAHRFDATGTHLERYARRFPSVEINSCFYRPHRQATYARWHESTPPDFQFAVKLTRRITHDLRLRQARHPFVEFLDETGSLAEKRGPILVQLPPSFSFDRATASRFFAMARSLYDGPLVLEPRHPTWFAPAVESLLIDHQVARVVADPPPVPAVSVPAGWPGTMYVRLHGSPRIYRSAYEADDISALARTLAQASTTADVWCIFDNTAAGAALENAWELQQRIASS
jgi:uncharacterized protein YecE (DUF72 family)